MVLANANVGIVLLAAGGSSRIGSPKQLLPFNGQSLVQRAAETALATGCDPVVVVTGYEAGLVRKELSGLSVWIVENETWREGIGASIRAGIAALEQTEVVAALITQCDQPLITAADLEKLLTVGRAHPGSIVVSHDQTVEAPALLPRQWFPELLQLRGDQGIRHLLLSSGSAVRRVDLKTATVEIDTPESYARFLGTFLPLT